MKKRFNRILLGGLAVTLLLAAVGAVYEAIASHQDRKTYLPVGKRVEIAGGLMHVYEAGEGETTVVFASGWGTASPYADFYPLYDSLVPHAKVVVYDRFGYGFSGVTKRKRDVDAATDELRELLAVTGQQPPYVLVGHSIGSLNVLRYAQRYPEEVKGIVMIDGGSPEYYRDAPSFTFMSYAYRAAVKTGLARALYTFAGWSEKTNDQRNALRLLPEPLRELDDTATLLLTGNRNMTDELRRARANAEAIIRDGKPLPLPITVLTAGDFGELDRDPAWRDAQAAFRDWSTEGKQIVVADARHYMHHYRPDAVAAEILALVEGSGK